MRYLSILCFSVLLVSQLFCQDWETMVDVGGRFQIDFPHPPKYKASDLKSNDRVITNEAFYIENAEQDHPNTLYLLNILQYGEVVAKMNDIDELEEFISNTVFSIATSNGGTVSYNQTTWDEEGKSNTFFRIAIPKSNQIIKGRLLINGLGDVFVAQVYSFTDKSLNEFVDQFLKSLKPF